MHIYYAQNREDLLIKSFFPDIDNGFYIDVGANEPSVDSVTKIFYDNGWSGINVEPNPVLYRELVLARPRDINLNIGIGAKEGNLNFREYPNGNGLSTFDDNMKQEYLKNQTTFTKEFRDYRVNVTTLEKVCQENKIEHIHFLKVDVEGYEYEVIQGFKWKKYRPELICIEANHLNEKDWRVILERNGYKNVFFDGVNLYYLAKESLNRLKHFDYPSAVFAGNPINIRSYLDLETKIVKPTQRELKMTKQSLEQLQREYDDLKRSQTDLTYLFRTLTKQTMLKVGALFYIKNK